MRTNHNTGILFIKFSYHLPGKCSLLTILSTVTFTMHFEKIEILDWLKTASEAPIDFTASGMASPENLSDLGIKVDDLPIHGDNFYSYKPLRDHLAKVYGISQECITVNAGASIGNFAALSVLHKKVNQITVEEPAYEPFIRLANAIAGTTPERLPRSPESQYHLDPYPPLLMDGKPRILLMANPHNPTGIFEKPETIARIANRLASDGGWMLIDEVFVPFLESGERLSYSKLKNNIVTTCSLTKVWGLSSLRIGWISGPEEVIHDIERTLDSINVIQPFITEYIAYHVMCETDIGNKLLLAARKIASKHLSIVKEYLDKLPEVSYTTPDAGISLLIRFKDGRDADKFCDNLESEYGVRVINGRYFEVQNGFRMSYGVDEETLRKGLEAITKAIRTS